MCYTTEQQVILFNVDQTKKLSDNIRLQEAIMVSEGSAEL